jgi:hypothetical protein
MRQGFALVTVLCVGALFVAPAAGSTIYNNLTPNNSMAIATRPDTAGSFEIEAGDDFVLGTHSFITTASFVGLIVPGASGAAPTVSEIVAEMYWVFPLDSDTTRTPAVPTRMNSPSDVAFESRDSASSELTFTTTVLASTFTALNSIQPGGIHVNTTGNGPITGQEVQFDLTLTSPFDLPADHFFFVPQVALTNGAQFYWLSASRPISGAGTTPITPDLQAWTRDEPLQPDWLRVGTDIVGGGATAPTFNTAFSLQGEAVPEPGTTLLFLTAGTGLIAIRRYVKR